MGQRKRKKPAPPDPTPSLFGPGPSLPPRGTEKFDGETYVPKFDKSRLGQQLRDVWNALADGEWHTASEIEARSGHGWGSASARIRDFRKKKFGAHQVPKERFGPPRQGVWRYRLIINTNGVQ
jgi:hypothetical protein